MKCLKPLRIFNKYTNKWSYVGCRKCDACLIADANNKALMLRTEMQKNWYMLFVTLTYDNDNLPIVFYGDNKIRRFNHGNLDVIDILPKIIDLEPHEPFNHPCLDCTGVLYYRDFQLFNKRLRIRLNRNGIKSPKFFVLCEYGSARKRPHFHVLYFFQRPIDFERFTQFVIKSWRLCNETSIREGIKFVNPGLSTYLASYVNGNVNRYRFASEKYFKQKTHRSAYLDYGCNQEDKEVLREAVNSGIFGFDDTKTLRPFERFDVSEKGDVSVRLLSKRVLDTYFSKPYGFSSLSPHAFGVRCRIIRKFIDGCITQDKPQLKSADLSFYRGYKRFLNLMDWIDHESHFDVYITIFLRVHSLYNSVLLYRYMQTFEHKTPKQYFNDAYNSISLGFNSREYWKSLLNDFGFVGSDLPHVLSDVTIHQIHDYIFDYKMKLLPKHYNNLYNFNF